MPPGRRSETSAQYAARRQKMRRSKLLFANDFSQLQNAYITKSEVTSCHFILWYHLNNHADFAISQLWTIVSIRNSSSKITIPPDYDVVHAFLASVKVGSLLSNTSLHETPSKSHQSVHSCHLPKLLLHYMMSLKLCFIVAILLLISTTASRHEDSLQLPDDIVPSITAIREVQPWYSDTTKPEFIVVIIILVVIVVFSLCCVRRYWQEWENRRQNSLRHVPEVDSDFAIQ